MQGYHKCEYYSDKRTSNKRSLYGTDRYVGWMKVEFQDRYWTGRCRVEDKMGK